MNKLNFTMFLVKLRTPSRANYEYFHVYLAYRRQTGTVVTRQTYDRAPRLTRPPTAHIFNRSICRENNPSHLYIIKSTARLRHDEQALPPCLMKEHFTVSWFEPGVRNCDTVICHLYMTLLLRCSNYPCSRKCI